MICMVVSRLSFWSVKNIVFAETQYVAPYILFKGFICKCLRRTKPNTLVSYILHLVPCKLIFGSNWKGFYDAKNDVLIHPLDRILIAPYISGRLISPCPHKFRRGLFPNYHKACWQDIKLYPNKLFPKCVCLSREHWQWNLETEWVNEASDENVALLLRSSFILSGVFLTIEFGKNELVYPGTNHTSVTVYAIFHISKSVLIPAFIVIDTITIT